MVRGKSFLASHEPAAAALWLWGPLPGLPAAVGGAVLAVAAVAAVAVVGELRRAAVGSLRIRSWAENGPAVRSGLPLGSPLALLMKLLRFKALTPFWGLNGCCDSAA